MLKMASESFIHALLLFKISRWVPLYTVQWLSGLHPRQEGGGGGGYSGFQLIGIEKNNSLCKHGKIHQEYNKS